MVQCYIDLPFKPQLYQHTCSSHTSYSTKWENLLAHQDILSMVISSLFLMTFVCDQVVIL